jgi:hypothetical protein
VEVAVERFVEPDPEAVSAFLWDLENRWLLADRFVELVSLEPRGGVGDRGTVRLRGPVGLRRMASTRVLPVSPGELLGSAEIGRRTRARLRWTLSPRENGTAVRLSATVLKPRAASAGISTHVPLASPKLRIRPPLSSRSNARRATSPPDAVEHEALGGGGRPTERVPNEGEPWRLAAGLRQRELSNRQS